MKRSTRTFAALAYFTAPWSRLAVGPGGRLSDVFVVAALASIWLFTAPAPRPGHEPGFLYVPGEARRHVFGVLLIAGGISAGSLWTALNPIPVVEAVLNATLTALPLVLLLRIRADRALRSLLATAFVAGVVVSILTAPLVGFAAQRGRWQGLTGHMNQLGMTIAMCLPLLALVLPRHRLRAILVPVAGFILLVGLERSGSRSGAMASLVVLVWLAVSWRIRNPGSLLRPKVALTVAAAALGIVLALPSLTVPVDEESDTLRSRVFAGGTAENSDEKRAELLASKSASVFTLAALLGSGYSTEEQSPHNAFLELYLVGGVAAAAGGLIIFLPTVRAAFSAVLGADRRRPVRPSARFGAAVVAWMVAISLNNLFWARFGWMALALFVVAKADERRTAEAAAEAAGEAPARASRAPVPLLRPLRSS